MTRQTRHQSPQASPKPAPGYFPDTPHMSHTLPVLFSTSYRPPLHSHTYLIFVSFRPHSDLTLSMYLRPLCDVGRPRASGGVCTTSGPPSHTPPLDNTMLRSNSAGRFIHRSPHLQSVRQAGVQTTSQTDRNSDRVDIGCSKGFACPKRLTHIMPSCHRWATTADTQGCVAVSALAACTPSTHG